MLQISPGRQLAARQAKDGIALAVFGKHIAPVIHHRDLVGLEPFHGIGDQKADGVDRGRGQLGLRLGADEDRSAGMLVIVQQQAVFRHHDHDAGRFHFIQLADGAGQFPLDRADVVRPLHEVRDAKVGFVKNLETDAIPMRDSLGRELHAHEVDLILGHVDRAPALANLVRHFQFIEDPDDLGGFGVIQLSIKQRVIHAAGPKGQAQQRGHHDPGGEHDADPLVEAELLPDAEKLPAQ